MSINTTSMKSSILEIIRVPPKVRAVLRQELGEFQAVVVAGAEEGRPAVFTLGREAREGGREDGWVNALGHRD